MKKQVLSVVVLGTALLLSSCTGNPRGVAEVTNLKDATAQPSVQEASAVPPTQEITVVPPTQEATAIPPTQEVANTGAQPTATAFVAAAALFGSPTPSGEAGSGTATPIPPTQDTIVASPTATNFVAAYVLFGTPTPADNVAAGQLTAAATATSGSVVASAPTATPPTAATLPPTATTAASTGSTGGSTGAGDPVAGSRVFTGIGGCSSCHDVSAGLTIVGPSLKGIAKTAETRKPGMSAHDYIYESITNPNAYVVKGFAPGIMIQTFKQTLSAKQINDVIAYLLTLK
ncbi:MAG: cytochrome c [Anaerolineae bacterium]|nr:cytochrome c [Anaerolineae bacterium]